MAAFIRRYGYLALALGLLLEGEGALIAASVAVHGAHLILLAIIGIAFVVTLVLGWGYFFLGCCQGWAYLISRPPLVKKVEKTTTKLSAIPKD